MGELRTGGGERGDEDFVKPLVFNKEVPKAQAIAESQETDGVEEEVNEEKKAEVTSRINEMKSELPEGIVDVEVQTGPNGGLSVRVDSLTNDQLDPFLQNVLKPTLEISGFTLGDHIIYGFSDDGQADGWHLKEIEN